MKEKDGIESQLAHRWRWISVLRRKALSAFVLVSLFLSLLLTVASTRLLVLAEETKHEQEALSLFNRATDMYQTMIKFDPDILKMVNKSIRLNPRDAHAYTFRGKIYADLGDSRQSIRDHNKAIQLKPNSWEYLYKARSELKLGRYHDVILDCNKSIDIMPLSNPCFFERGAAYYKLGKYQQALADLKKTSIHNPYALYYLGLTYIALNDKASARVSLENAEKFCARVLDRPEEERATHVNYSKFEQVRRLINEELKKL